MTPVRDQVFLRQHPLRWKKLSIDIRIGLRKKRDEIADIRAAIAERAKVPFMPPVEIFDVAWVPPDLSRCISGKAGVVVVDGRTHFGVQLAGAPVLFAEVDALRGLLLHEFAHCFWNLQVSLASTERGERGLDLHATEEELFNSAVDRAKMVNPEDWFAPEDCAIFPYHDSELLQGCADQVLTKWVAKRLPYESPPSGFKVEKLTYAEEVANHIRELGRAARR
jgi:hypothetical protein